MRKHIHSWIKHIKLYQSVFTETSNFFKLIWKNNLQINCDVYVRRYVHKHTHLFICDENEKWQKHCGYFFCLFFFVIKSIALQGFVIILIRVSVCVCSKNIPTIITPPYTHLDFYFYFSTRSRLYFFFFTFLLRHFTERKMAHLKYPANLTFRGWGSKSNLIGTYVMMAPLRKIK